MNSIYNLDVMVEKHYMPWLKAWREHRGRDQVDLAAAISRVPAIISRIENQKQPMREEQIALAAAFLDVTPAELMDPPPGYSGALPHRPTSDPVPAKMPVQAPATLPIDLPLRGVAAGSFSTGAFQISTGAEDYVRRPPGLAGRRNAYAIQVVGESMYPRFEQGELVYVDPGRVPRPREKGGDDVVFVVQTDEHSDPEAYIKRLVRLDDQVMVVEQFNPPTRIEWERKHVVQIHMVLRNNDLQG